MMSILARFLQVLPSSPNPHQREIYQPTREMQPRCRNSGTNVAVDRFRISARHKALHPIFLGEFRTRSRHSFRHTIYFSLSDFAWNLSVSLPHIQATYKPTAFAVFTLVQGILESSANNDNKVRWGVSPCSKFHLFPQRVPIPFVDFNLTTLKSISTTPLSSSLQLCSWLKSEVWETAQKYSPCTVKSQGLPGKRPNLWAGCAWTGIRKCECRLGGGGLGGAVENCRTDKIDLSSTWGSQWRISEDW